MIYILNSYCFLMTGYLNKNAARSVSPSGMISPTPCGQACPSLPSASFSLLSTSSSQPADNVVIASSSFHSATSGNSFSGSTSTLELADDWLAIEEAGPGEESLGGEATVLTEANNLPEGQVQAFGESSTIKQYVISRYNTNNNIP